MKRGMIAVIGMILVLVLILVAFMGPWFSMAQKSDDDEGWTNLYFNKAETKSGKDADVETEDFDSDFREDNEDSDWLPVLDTTMYMTLIALIFAILALIGVLGTVFNFGKPETMKMLGAIFGILTFIIAIVAPLYFMTSYPGAAELKDKDGEDAGFFYSEEVDYGAGFKFTISWGPGYAWWLMIVASLIALVFAVQPLIKKEFLY